MRTILAICMAMFAAGCAAPTYYWNSTAQSYRTPGATTAHSISGRIYTPNYGQTYHFSILMDGQSLCQGRSPGRTTGLYDGATPYDCECMPRPGGARCLVFLNNERAADLSFFTKDASRE